MSTVGLEYAPPHPKNLLPDFVDACQALDGLVKSVQIGTATCPNGQTYWLVYAKPHSGKCIALSTFELRHLQLSEQVPDICRQMQELAPILLDWLQKMPVGPARLSTLLDES